LAFCMKPVTLQPYLLVLATIHVSVDRTSLRPQRHAKYA
jgi:hypothetical protein